jgi:hypothetical protein
VLSNTRLAKMVPLRRYGSELKIEIYYSKNLYLAPLIILSSKNSTIDFFIASTINDF